MRMPTAWANTVHVCRSGGFCGLKEFTELRDAYKITKRKRYEDENVITERRTCK